MYYDIIDDVQMIIFFLCVVALIFIIIRSRIKDAQDIGNIDRDKLRRTIPKPVDEAIVKGIKKSRWMTVFFGFIVVWLIRGVAGSKLYSMYCSWRVQELGVQPSELGEELFKADLIMDGIIILMGILLIVLWIIYDMHKTKRVEDKVLIPAYVQSTFTHPRAKTKTVQLIYYDYKKDKFRLKRVPVEEYEVDHVKLYRRDKVEIIAIENRNSVKYVALHGRLPDLAEY